MLFITLTYDTKRCDPDTAWKHIGEEFHLFHNKLRKQFGKVEIFRTWESTNNFYPHVHMIALFWDHSFNVIKHEDRTGVISYRIPYKTRTLISNYWHSNVDVQALQNTHEGLNELTKYITKDLCSEKGDKTNSMIWLHRKQSYSVSKNFVKQLTGWNINLEEPSNFDLINEMCNCNHDIINWEFIGILRGRDLRLSGDVWCLDLKKPPPRVMDLLIHEFFRWRGRGGSYSL